MSWKGGEKRGDGHPPVAVLPPPPPRRRWGCTSTLPFSWSSLSNGTRAWETSIKVEKGVRKDDEEPREGHRDEVLLSSMVVVGTDCSGGRGEGGKKVTRR